VSDILYIYIYIVTRNFGTPNVMSDRSVENGSHYAAHGPTDSYLTR